ncbi:uncharacterized protein DUF1080 [Maribacter vaceletii]|uniref:Uncharacterized protein DUF1080 n=1 Tax=Maribacter vaceletii TaxID=1206816 RepID=A0A495EBV2_9FLAO|nr:DUF1080 domain-containing protein [Maribacter vaceletii]RKR14368.1 uncharacterized protein DUF1080 [Maribacter vaceletii]
MKINTKYYYAGLFLLLNVSIFVGCKSSKKLQYKNTSNIEEWISLFNGKNLEGWDIKFTGKELNDNYKNTFVAEDSMLRIKYDAYSKFNNDFGHLYYKKPFAYYKLSFDYRFTGEQTKGGSTSNNRNSGIMLHSQSAISNEFDQQFPVSVELQLLGGLKDKKARPTGNVCTPGTLIVTGENINYKHCVSSSSKTYYGDQWVHAEAIVLGGESMAFIVENDTVLKFKTPQIGSLEKNKQYRGENWKKWKINKETWSSKTGEILNEGYIALQAESHPIDFKNLKVLDLCGCKDPKAKNYKTYYIKNKPESCYY